MYKKIAVLVSFMLSMHILLIAQKGVFALRSHYIGITYGGNLTGKVDVYRNYQKNEINDIRSIPSLGREARVSYLYILNPNWQIETGISMGDYSATFRVILSDEFNHLGWGGFDDIFEESIAVYWGLYVGMNYSIYLDEKFSLDLGMLINATSFTTLEFEDTPLDIYAETEVEWSKTLFYASFRLDERRSVYFSPELKLRLNYKLDKHFVLAATLSGVYSRTPFMTVEKFGLFGDDEILTGRIEEKFKHIGLGLAVFYKIK